jgi:hypothetical protein
VSAYLVLFANLDPLPQLACGSEIARLGLVAQQANDRVRIGRSDDDAARPCRLCRLPFAASLPTTLPGLGCTEPAEKAGAYRCRSSLPLPSCFCKRPPPQVFENVPVSIMPSRL